MRQKKYIKRKQCRNKKDFKRGKKKKISHERKTQRTPKTK